MSAFVYDALNFFEADANVTCKWFVLVSFEILIQKKEEVLIGAQPLSMRMGNK